MSQKQMQRFQYENPKDNTIIYYIFYFFVNLEDKASWLDALPWTKWSEHNKETGVKLNRQIDSKDIDFNVSHRRFSARILLTIFDFFSFNQSNIDLGRNSMPTIIAIQNDAFCVWFIMLAAYMVAMDMTSFYLLLLLQKFLWKSQWAFWCSLQQ